MFLHDSSQKPESPWFFQPSFNPATPWSALQAEKRFSHLGSSWAHKHLSPPMNKDKHSFAVRFLNWNPSATRQCYQDCHLKQWNKSWCCARSSVSLQMQMTCAVWLPSHNMRFTWIILRWVTQRRHPSSNNKSPWQPPWYPSFPPPRHHLIFFSRAQSSSQNNIMCANVQHGS